jgi:hypothetical protein
MALEAKIQPMYDASLLQAIGYDLALMKTLLAYL